MCKLKKTYICQTGYYSGMARIRFNIFILMALAVTAGAQDKFSLERCREAARLTGGVERLLEAIEDSRDAGSALARSPFQLQAGAYGSASFQSDVPNPASMTDFPFELYPISKFQYRAGLAFALPLYSGGQKGLSDRLDSIERDQEKLGVDIRTSDLDRVVDDVFLSIVLGRKSGEILRSQLRSLSIKLGDMRAAFESGKVYRNSVLALEARCSALEARISGNDSETSGAIKVLSIITGLEIGDDAEFELPTAFGGRSLMIDPALARLDLEGEKIELKRQLSHASALPTIKAIGNIGYGKSPLNVFENSPEVFGVVGVSLIIPISDWRDVENRGRLLDAAASTLEIRREQAIRRKDSQIRKLDSEIDKYDALIASGEKTIEKYEALCRELDSLTHQGIVPASEYVTALEQLSAARLDNEFYTILKLQASLQRENCIATL